MSSTYSSACCSRTSWPSPRASPRATGSRARSRTRSGRSATPVCLGADAVGLAILRPLAAVAERLLFVPLPLRDDVADLVVGQANQHAVRAAQLLVDRRLDRRRREVGAGIGRVLHLVEHQFRINLPRNGGNI